MKKNFGFTLAEVLITLGIIGLVAALTIPTLMQKTNERETVAKVKKYYSVLSNAWKLAYANNGKYNGTSSEDLYNYISPYLNISKYCGREKGCWADVVVKSLDGSNWLNIDTNTRYYTKAVLTDGASISFYSNETRSNIEFRIDINGTAGPNTQGIDIFLYNPIINDGAFSMKRGNNDPEYPDDGTTIKLCDKKITDNDVNGASCAKWILHNDNMDYIHCSDLSWNGKTKCD